MKSLTLITATLYNTIILIIALILVQTITKIVLMIIRKKKTFILMDNDENIDNVSDKENVYNCDIDELIMNKQM